MSSHCSSHIYARRKIWLDGLAAYRRVVTFPLRFDSYMTYVCKRVYREAGLLRVAKTAEFSAIVPRG